MNAGIISDASCLIVLSNSGQLDLLQALFAEIIVTPEVAAEFGMPLPDWIRQQSPKEASTQKFLETQLDIGEASAISLALERRSSILLIDEKKGRTIAVALGLQIIGTERKC